MSGKLKIEGDGASRGQGATSAGGLDDAVRAEMREIIARYPQARSALLPMLHLVQSYEGCVTSEGIEMCADELDLTTAEVSAVATFYTMYKRRPVGDYHVGVCTNTLCAIMGGDAIWASLTDKLGIGHDETTDDGKVSLERVECNAACDFAPVMMVNWEFMDNQTPESAGELVEKLADGQPVKSTRGPSICTFKEASRVLAGFADGRAGEGEQAGAATLAGLVLAHERGWAAPEGGRPALAGAGSAAAATAGAGSGSAAAASRPAPATADNTGGSAAGAGAGSAAAASASAPATADNTGGSAAGAGAGSAAAASRPAPATADNTGGSAAGTKEGS